MTTVSDLGPGAVVVRAWAPWCANCRAMHPVVNDVAASSRIRVVDLRVDHSPEFTDQLRIRSVPTLVAMRDGVEVGRLVGAQPRPAIESLFGAAADETVEVRSGAPAHLVVVRVGAGATLAAAGFVLGTITLIAAGAALTLWGLVGMTRRAPIVRPQDPT